MKLIEHEIIDFLATIKSAGNFVASGSQEFIMPNIEVKGFGELALPVTALQAKKLIKVAHKAPFGKGSKTILNDEVRKSWEIDASEITFNNPEWNKWLDKLLTEVKEKLGIGKAKIKASLYKMLVYEKGDFFTWHKDSEKEPNMFATLSITLPSKYKGGELAVRFQDEEIVVDLAKESNANTFAYSAFYADCDHEIRPLTQGYRVSLVYNLLQTSEKEGISAFNNLETEETLAQMLQEWRTDFEDGVKVILLDHQYTPTNFSISQLKLADKPRAQMLMKAAEKTGFFARLALLTHYQSGEIDYNSIKPKRGKRRRWDYEDYDDDELSTSSIGEIFEEYRKIEEWAEANLPTIGEVTVNNDMIISRIITGQGEPIEKQAEGYTGNAGMTIDYWYHYGAVVLWNEASHAKILSSLVLPDAFEWLKYYVQRKDTDKKAIEYLKIILSTLQVSKERLRTYHKEKLDATGVIDTWAILKDEESFVENYQHIVPLFIFTSYEGWARLISAYPADAFNPIFKDIAAQDDIALIEHWVALFEFLQKDKNYQDFAASHIKSFPVYLANLPKYLVYKSNTDFIYFRFMDSENEKHHKHVRNIIKSILEISADNQTDSWIDGITSIFTSTNNRDYVNDVLIKALIENAKFKTTKLYLNLYAFAGKDLQNRVDNTPQPLPNWTRPIPEHSSNYSKFWDILRNFMDSPVLQIFNYQAVLEDRNNMQYAIKRAKVDLQMTTIKKGSPHTLQITKNNAEYQQNFKNWETDVKLLDSILAIYQ